MNRIALITLISISTLLTGCGTTQITYQNSAKTTSDSGVVTQNRLKTTAPNLTSETTNQPYSITTATFSQDKIKLQYPQINGLADKSKENTINDLIKNDVLNSQVEEPIKFLGRGNFTADMKYQVTMRTSELLSVVFTGTAYVEGSAFPTNDIYAITIDLKKATKLRLSDFTNIDTNLARKIKQSTAVTNESAKEGMDKSTLITAIKDMNDQTLIQGLTEQWNYNTFYVTPTSLLVSVDVAHAIGDYAIVELPGQYTKKQ